MQGKTLKGESLNITEEKLARLRELLPEAFSEGKVDWEKLRIALGEEKEFSDERYHLNWAGKTDAFRSLQAPTTATLAPCPEESVDFDGSDNVFIEGENLEALKILQKSYFGKVKMIYIDPPYNTGNDHFIYPDRFAESKDAYLKRVGDRDEQGFVTRAGLFSKNNRENGHFHSNWLSMIYPRLFLARNLLREDGVIFVSIDDNEAHNLRMVMNEIFGEENFINQFIWTSKKGAQGMQTKYAVVSNHEYILVYSKHCDHFNYLGIERSKDSFSNPDQDDRGIWKRQYLQRLGQNLPKRTVTDPNTGKEYSFETPYTQQKLDTWVVEDRIIFPANEKGYPARKEFYNEYKNKQQLITSLGLFPTKASTERLYALFNKEKIFTNPKPEELLSFLVKSTTTANDIILDFFAGSCTIAHAVMQLNASDRGNRRFICVQMPEPCDKKSGAFKAGYKTIADIGKERIRRVIKNDDLDVGFKVFKLQDSNFKIWRGTEIQDEKELEKQLKMHTASIVNDAKTENILYELLLKSGFPLTAPIEAQDGWFMAQDGEATLALALERIDKRVIKAVQNAAPQKFITLDHLFENNDQLKTNTALQMEDAGIAFDVV